MKEKDDDLFEKKKSKKGDIDDEEIITEAVNEDEISPEEEGFMLGYNEALEEAEN